MYVTQTDVDDTNSLRPTNPFLFLHGCVNMAMCVRRSVSSCFLPTTHVQQNVIGHGDRPAGKTILNARVYALVHAEISAMVPRDEWVLRQTLHPCPFGKHCMPCVFVRFIRASIHTVLGLVCYTCRCMHGMVKITWSVRALLSKRAICPLHPLPRYFSDSAVALVLAVDVISLLQTYLTGVGLSFQEVEKLIVKAVKQRQVKVTVDHKVSCLRSCW